MNLLDKLRITDPDKMYDWLVHTALDSDTGAETLSDCFDTALHWYWRTRETRFQKLTAQIYRRQKLLNHEAYF